MTTLQSLITNNDGIINNRFDGLLPDTSQKELWDNIYSLKFNQFCIDSRHISQDDAFVLLASHSGNITNSANYLVQAAKKAKFIISEILPSDLFTAQPKLQTIVQDIPIYYAPLIRQCLGSLIQNSLLQINPIEHKPVHLPKVIAVTGTNGKTTISQLTAQLLQQLDNQVAVMGTAGNGRLNNLVQASHTTGSVLSVQNFLYQMAKDGVDTLCLEASSHGLDQLRLQGVPVNIAIYTNLSRDHLDYHQDMDDYATAKSKLFNRQYFPELTHAIINIDDEYAETMLQAATNSNVTVWTYSCKPQSQATFVARKITPSLTGATIELDSKFGQTSINSPLLGLFNVANLLAAIAASIAAGATLEKIPNLVTQLQGANGRMQRINHINMDTQVDQKHACFIVDYAHTPDALQQVLNSLKAHCQGDLWAVFGCGGDRDKGKRPLMAQAGLAIADKVVLTADNPRSEDPIDILNDMQQGMNSNQYQKTHIEPDRKLAIQYAVKHAQSNDIVVIAGKGHETYQEIKGIKHDFDDKVMITDALLMN